MSGFDVTTELAGDLTIQIHFNDEMFITAVVVEDPATDAFFELDRDETVRLYDVLRIAFGNEGK